MSKAKGGSRGRIPASKRSPAQEANGARRLASNEQGDLGEVAFLHKAMSLGFAVAKPYGQNHGYDFIVEGGKNLWRVQVKTCAAGAGDLYKVGIYRCLNGVRVPYTDSELDFVVVYIMPKKTWYVLPAREVAVQRLAVEHQAGREPLDDAGESGAVGLSRRDQVQRHRR